MSGRLRKGHVAFFSFPLPACVNPTLPVVAVLARRGFRVSCVTPDRFAAKFAALGAEVVACPAFNISVPIAESWARYALATLAQVASFYARNRPDLVIYDLPALAGRISAQRWNVPAVHTSPTFALDRENLSRQVPPTDYRLRLLEHSRLLDEFLQQQGTASDGFLFHRERLNIYMFPDVLQPPGHVFADNCFYAGRCAGEQPYLGDWHPNETSGRPVVLVSTSTSYVQGPQFFRMCIEALAGLGWRVLLMLGDVKDASELVPLPPHFEIVQGVSQVKLLAHSNLFICAGGIATQSESMYHGVPLLTLTHEVPELEWLGDHIARLGLGIHVRKSEMNALIIRDAARRILEDEAMLGRVRQTQHSVKRAPGGEEAVNRIEEYLSTF